MMGARIKVEAYLEPEDGEIEGDLDELRVTSDAFDDLSDQLMAMGFTDIEITVEGSR